MITVDFKLINSKNKSDTKVCTQHNIVGNIMNFILLLLGLIFLILQIVLSYRVSCFHSSIVGSEIAGRSVWELQALPHIGYEIADGAGSGEHHSPLPVLPVHES